MQESAKKVEKISLNWAKLIARIYEVNPLLCTCGKKMKIVAFVTQPAEIRRFLSGIGQPTEFHEFDPPYKLPEREICQLLPWTEDGFLPDEAEIQITEVAGPDPPFIDCTSDPPFIDCTLDSPHWSD